MSNNFSIGQIVYILSHKTTTVIPALVVEQSTIQTLDGKKISWKFAVGSEDKQKTIDSNRLEGEIFTSLDDIKKTLIGKFVKVVDTAILNASKQEKIWYEPQLKKMKSSTQDTENKIDPSSLLDLNDGISSTQNISLETNKDDQKKKLKELLTSDLDDVDTETITEDPEAISEIIDGKKKVKVQLTEQRQ